jgi:hypothetical protein
MHGPTMVKDAERRGGMKEAEAVSMLWYDEAT